MTPMRPLLLALVALPLTLAAQAPRDSLLVSPGWLAARLADPAVVVLQVERTPAAYAEAHLPGARLIPFAGIVVERDGVPNELPPVIQLDSLLEGAGVSTRSRIVIVGEPLVAARLFFTLDYLGLRDRAALLDGGLPAWRAAGFPVSQDTPLVARGRLEPRPQPDLVVDADWLRPRLGTGQVVLLDARPEGEFAGQPPGEGVARGGHLPGAASLFWRHTQTNTEPPVLRSPQELAALLHGAGATAERELVTYCRTGVQASYLYFVARTQGLAPRLYDGSFLDWSRHPDLPIE